MILIESTSIDKSDPIWAIAVSESSNSPMKFKLGAVIVDKKGRILGSGFNSGKTHPKYGSKPPFCTLHAEGAAIVSAKNSKTLSRAYAIYIYRRNNFLSKPCHCCLKMLQRLGIKKVVFTNNNEKW